MNQYFNVKECKNDDDLISNIVISHADFLSSVKTIQKSINKEERQNLNEL